MDYVSRRKRLMASLPEDAIVYFFSGEAPATSADQTYPFVVDRHFYYLTGIDHEKMILVLVKKQGVVSETLFIEPFDEIEARWIGPRMQKEEATSISSIVDVRYLHEESEYFASLFDRYFRAKGTCNIYLDAWQQTATKATTKALTFANLIKQKYPTVRVNDIFPYIVPLRLKKDEEEIAELKKAIMHTRIGIEAIMKNIKPKQNERLLEGIFDFALMQSGCKEHAFDTIAASGQRATTLHYHDNNQVIEDGELFLCDLGAASNHYCADISRTFPVNGKFTPRQKEIYELVLTAQSMVLQAAKPGVTIRELNNIVIDFYREELPKHGLYKDVSEYYFHGVGHHLGLDTHDVDGGLGQVLKEGYVITDEPGLYIRDEGIGVRIEDDIYITSDGCELLSKDIIKSVEDIEKFMQH